MLTERILHSFIFNFKDTEDKAYKSAKCHLSGLEYGTLLQAKQKNNTCIEVQYSAKHLDLQIGVRDYIRSGDHYTTKDLTTELGFILWW
jgi:hypothetical protein